MDIDTLEEDIKQAREKYNSQKLMFSKEAGLMCSVTANGKYFVHNGQWYGSKDGDKFTIHSSYEGLNKSCDDQVIRITDWKEIRMDSLSQEEKAAWYLPLKPHLLPSSREDDVAF